MEELGGDFRFSARPALSVAGTALRSAKRWSLVGLKPSRNQSPKSGLIKAGTISPLGEILFAFCASPGQNAKKAPGKLPGALNAHNSRYFS